MTARRLFTATALALTAALAVSACSSDSGDDQSAEPSAPPAESDTSLTDVQEAGVLVVGTEGTYRPFSFHEDGSGDLTGYDVEVIRAVAEELGVEVRFEETQWDAIFAGLEAGRFDVIANQVSITPEREEAYTFSEPYTYSPGVIVVREGDDSIGSFADLEGKTTAQSLTSNWYTLAEENGATIEAVEGWAQAVALVEQGRVDDQRRAHVPGLQEADRCRRARRRGRDRRRLPQRLRVPLRVHRARRRRERGARCARRRRHPRRDLRGVLRRGRLPVTGPQ